MKLNIKKNKQIIYILLFVTINFLINNLYPTVIDGETLKLITLTYSAGLLVATFIFKSKWNNNYVLLMFVTAIFYNMSNVFGYLHLLSSINPIGSLILFVLMIIFAFKTITPINK